jgi:hypothetical protein
MNNEREWSPQLTIGDLICKLEQTGRLSLKSSAYRWVKQVVIGGYQLSYVVGFGSYRGFYDQFAIYVDDQTPGLTVDTLLEGLREVVDKQISFHGYKGGEYTYDRSTPVWIAQSSDTGVPLHGVKDSCHVILTSEHQWWYDSEEGVDVNMMKKPHKATPVEQPVMKYTFIVNAVISMHVDVEAVDLDAAVKAAQAASVQGLCHHCAKGSQGKWSTSGELDTDPASSTLVSAYEGEEELSSKLLAKVKESW